MNPQPTPRYQPCAATLPCHLRLAAPLLAICLALTALGLHAQIFVANYFSRNVGEYAFSGATINASLFTPPGSPIGMTSDGTSLYVSTQDPIGLSKYSTSGAAQNLSLIQGLNYPGSMTTDGNGHLFVFDSGPDFMGRIGEYTTSGEVINAALIPGAGDVRALACDGNGHLFVAKAGLYDKCVSEYSTSGQLLQDRLISGLNIPWALALDGAGHLFVSCYGSSTVGEYTLSGDTVNAALITLPGVGPMAYDGLGHLFVASYTSGVMQEYTTSGTRVSAFQVSGLSGPQRIVVIPEPSCALLMLLALGAFVASRPKWH